MVGVHRQGVRLSGRDPDDAASPAASSLWGIAEEVVAISDTAHVRAILVAAARQRQALSYAELLNALGHPFTRPRMRALCRTLDAIDEAAAAAGEPALAALVVRQSDGLPGQGWWIGTSAEHAYVGSWTGPEALAFVRGLQGKAFDFWQSAPAK